MSSAQPMTLTWTTAYPFGAITASFCSCRLWTYFQMTMTAPIRLVMAAAPFVTAPCKFVPSVGLSTPPLTRRAISRVAVDNQNSVVVHPGFTVGAGVGSGFGGSGSVRLGGCFQEGDRGVLVK